MKIQFLNINGRIDNDVLNTLIELRNSLNSDDLIGIYLNSDGGSFEVMEAMIHHINLLKSRVEIFAYGRICSAAFELFYSVTCKRHLIGGVVGMYHQSSSQVTINEQGKPEYYADIAKINYMKGYMKENTAAMCNSIGMSSKDKAKILKGQEVYFDNKQLQSFLNHK